MANRKRQQRRERRQERKAARQQSTNQQMQITSEVVGPGTDTGSVRFTPSEISGGNIYKTTSSQLPGAGFAFTPDKPLGQEGIDRINKVLGYDPSAATAAAPGTETAEAGGGRKKRKGLTIRGVRVGRSLSGEEAMDLAATGLGERAIDKALAKGASIQGSAQRRLDKGQLGTREQNILGNIFDQGGIPASLDPRSANLKGLRGLGLQRGQRYFGATGSGEPILGTKAMGGAGGGGGRRGTGGGGGTDETVPAAEPAVQEDSLIINEPTEETTPDMGGLMFGSTGTGPGAFGFKRRRGSRERNRLLQLGTGQLNRLKLRNALNIRGLTGLL
jgi:hypothetical protein